MVKCLPDILVSRSKQFADNLFYHLEEGIWVSYTPDTLVTLADHASSFLLDHHVNVGDRVGILSKASSPLWLALDLAIMQIGAISVPIHDGLSQKEIEYIEEDADLKIIFVHYDSLEKKPALSKESIHFYEDKNPNPGWAEWPFHSELENYKSKQASCDPDQLATIVYTSGSMGYPKGVMLSHLNIISNIHATLPLLPISSHHRVISFLPPSHIFERMVIYSYLLSGTTIYFVDHPREAFQHVQQVKPHFLTAVPRILEYVYESLIESSKSFSFVNKSIFNWAINGAKRFGSDLPKSFLFSIKLLLLRLFVFRRWRLALGGKIKGILVGAAAMNEEISRIFSAAGIPIRQGYGMTETSPVITFNRFETKLNRFGTVGLPIPNTSIEIRDPSEIGEGEIWINGPGVMLGYWKNEELTRQTIVNGWLNTGDVGMMMTDDFLKITGRKKDIFKTSSGKYVYPGLIEHQLHQSFFIDHALVIGFQKPYITALIVPRFEHLKKWCEQKKIHWTAAAYMVHNPKVEALFEEEIVKINTKLKPHEQIKKFKLLSGEWSPNSGELTTTHKLKRGYLMEVFNKEIEEIYEL